VTFGPFADGPGGVPSELTPTRRHLMERRTTRAAIVALASAAVMTASGCVIGSSYWVGADQCVVQFGPMDPSPNGPPDVVRPIIGDLVYETCWTAEY